MKPRMPVLALSFGLAVFCAAPAIAADFNAPADVAAITQIEHDLASFKPVPVLLGHYAPHAVMYDIQANFIGQAQIKANMEGQFTGVASMTSNIPMLQIVSDGSMACAALQSHFDVTLQDGTKLARNVRQLDVFRKIDGKWLIVQDHASYPADPQTGMAGLNVPMAPPAPIVWTGNPVAGPPALAATTASELRAWTSAFALAPNAQTLVKLVGPGDDEVVFDGFAGNGITGQAALLSYYEPQFAPMAGITMRYLQFETVSDGILGGEISLQKLNVTLKNAKKWPLVIRQNDCLHYVDGKWYTIFDMTSYPADEKTGKAIMNGS